MSDYAHNLKKFADAGLQLRLPVDLIPDSQYSALTNAIPIIEGELRTRDGMTLIGNATEIAFIFQFPAAATTATTANTIYANGLVPGDAVVITITALDPANAGQIVLGAYNVTVLAVVSSTQFTFTPGIAVTPVIATDINVRAIVTSTNPVNVLPNSVITNIYRLNEALPSLASERFVCMNGRVFHAPLPAGNVFTELVGPISAGTLTPTQSMGFGGGPMSIISFQFNLDTASWAIFADGNRMYKYRPGTTPSALEFVPLGNDFPTVAAIASAGGVGNLDSTGGTGYDWRYTYVDGLALTESNPSPIMLTPGSLTTTQPTAAHNGVDPFTGVTAHSGTGQESTTGGNGSSFSHTANCRWDSWLVPAGTVDSTKLNVVASFLASASSSGNAGGSWSAQILYSYDGGATFLTLATFAGGVGNGQSSSANTGSQTYSAVIPSSVSLSNISVKASVNISGGGAPGATITISATLQITNISIDAQVEASVNSLTLVNKIAQVCVQPPRDKWQTFINLYRRGGSLPDTWRFVSQSQVSALVAGVCVSGALEIDDNVSDTTLSTSDIIQLDNDQPVTSVNALNVPLSFIWGPVGIDARVLGVGDPARPESVYFSKPGNADAWPPQNWLPVSEPGTPMIAGCVFNTRTFAFSRESIYELVEGLGTGATYTPFRTPSAHGLFAAQGLAIGPAMYFIAKDGIYESTGAQEMSIVENDIKPLFPTYDTPGQSIEGYEAIDYTQPLAMRLRYHNDELYFAYIGSITGTRQVLIYDILKKRWRAMSASTGISELYSEPNTISSLLYGMNTGTIYQAGGTGDPTELDVIENMNFTTVAAVTTFPSVTMFFRAVRYTAAGPVALSYETSLAVTAAIGVQVTFPVSPSGTVKWRVFNGPSGAQANFSEFLESGLPANRTVTITGFGAAGTIPMNNVDSAIAVKIRTGAHDQGVPLNQKQYGNVIFDLDPGGATIAAPVTITPLVNGETITEAALTVTGSGRQQVPLDLSDYFGFNTEYDIEWTRTPLGGGVVTDPVLFQYDTLHFLEPVSVTHWASQPTSFEFPGFDHVRDGYIAIRSNATVTLSMTFDTGAGEVTQTFTLPSTGGERLKQYVQFNSNKGLLYRFSLDSTAGFRVYREDIEFRVKPWLGVLGYAVMRVVGGEAGA